MCTIIMHVYIIYMCVSTVGQVCVAVPLLTMPIISFRFVFFRQCGCVVSEKALKEVPSVICHKVSIVCVCVDKL